MVDMEELTQNGYTERLLCTIKEVELNLSEYQYIQECVQNTDQFLIDV